MPKKSTKTILAAIKKAGVGIEANDLDKVTEALEDLELSAEEFLGSDDIILTKDEHRELKDDLTKLRGRMKTAEQEATDLREAMDSGDSDNVRKATQYKKKLDELEPTLEKLLKVQKETWSSAADRIPEAVKKEFHFAEKGKDGKVTKDLTTDQLLHNVTKFEEYTRVGLIEGAGDGAGGDDDEKKRIPDAPRVGGKQKDAKKPTLDEMEKMDSASIVEAGYKPREAPKQE